MRWYQGFPSHIPPARCWVEWNGLVEKRYLYGGAYGKALMAIAEASKDPAFGWLEWDVAVDLDDFQAMEKMAEATHYQQVITADMVLYPTTLGMVDRPARVHTTFGMIVFPTDLLRRRQDAILALKYPNADAEFFSKIAAPVCCPTAHPKHLHFL